MPKIDLQMGLGYRKKDYLEKKEEKIVQFYKTDMKIFIKPDKLVKPHESNVLVFHLNVNYDVKKTAELLDKSKWSVRRLCRLGKLKAIKNKNYKIKGIAINNYLLDIQKEKVYG